MEKEIKYKRGKKKIRTVLAVVAFVLLCIFLQYVMMNVSMDMWTISPVAISVLGIFLIAVVKRRQEQNFNEYGEPVNDAMDYIPGFVWFFGKAFFVVWLLMWIKWTFPRLRIDQILTLEWKYLVPIGLANLLLMVIVVVFKLHF